MSATVNTVTRKYTNKILELVEMGVIDKDQLILSLLNWLSEPEVEEFFESELSDFED